jgi:hypothetical protein
VMVPSAFCCQKRESEAIEKLSKRHEPKVMGID